MEDKNMNKRTHELNRINNDLDKLLDPENEPAMTDIVCYLRGAGISLYNQEIIRQDLLEMVLSAQERGENIQTVIGTDYKTFCDEIIASFPPKSNKEKVIDFFDTVFLSLSIFCAINIIMANETLVLIHNLIVGEPLNFNISITSGLIVSLLIALVAAFAIVNFIMKNSFTIGNLFHNNRPTVLLVLGSFPVFLIIAWFGRNTVFTVNIFIALLFSLGLYLAHCVLSRL
jgi:DNA-binding ferritin-like protein (Dps family)